MGRNCFREIMRFLRFDMRSARLFRLQTDKFALISAVWDKFIENYIVCYKPGENIAVNKQLFPTKACCRLYNTTYGQQTGRIRYRILLVVDMKFKYITNAI